jgi:Putative transposase
VSFWGWPSIKGPSWVQSVRPARKLSVAGDETDRVGRERRAHRRLSRARSTRTCAISNRRLVALDDKGVTFKWKDYRIEGAERSQIMTLDTHEFIRRFLLHVLPQGFHRVRYYGFLTSQTRANNIIRIRA